MTTPAKRGDRSYLFFGPSGSGKTSAVASWLEHGDMLVLQTDARGKEDPLLEAIGLGCPIKSGSMNDGTPYKLIENPELFGGRKLKILHFTDKDPDAPDAFKRFTHHVKRVDAKRWPVLVIDSSSGVYDLCCQDKIINNDLDPAEWTFRNLATQEMKKLLHNTLPGFPGTVIVIAHIFKRWGSKSDSRDRGSLGGEEYISDYLPSLPGALADDSNRMFSEVYYFRAIARQDDDDTEIKRDSRIQTRASNLYYANTSAKMEAPNLRPWVRVFDHDWPKDSAYRTVHRNLDKKLRRSSAKPKKRTRVRSTDDTED